MSLVPCLAYIYKLDCTTCINPWKGRKAYWVIGFYGTCCESWVPSLRPIYVGICCPSFPLFGSENKKSVWNTTLVFNVLEFESSSMAVKIGKKRMPPYLLDPTNLIHKHILHPSGLEDPARRQDPHWCYPVLYIAVVAEETTLLLSNSVTRN